MSDDWQNGYSAGYQNGWEAGYVRGKTEGLPTNPYKQSPQQDWLRQQNFGTKCSVCGMYFEAGKAYGYVCGNSRCPTKVWSSTTAVATSNVCISSPNSQFVPFSVNAAAVPDGLSYEEIYGSVVYQQGRKYESS